jgi:CheY-like chemotaxis protein/two-component sensor histidine kinase
MTNLLDDLLDVSRISRDKLILRTERLELAAAIDQAVEIARPLIDARDHALTLELPPEPIMLDGDPTRLAQIFSNLLTNAAKYSEKGKPIRLNASRRGSEVVVSVKDDGIGIIAENLPRVFEMFSQIQTALNRSHGGLGIGLALVRKLVEMHGGSISAYSDGLNRGSEFIVRLPVADAFIPEATNPAAHGKSAQMQKHRILVADDLHDNAESMKMLLAVMGHEVRTAHDGAQAVQVAEEFRPGVVLLDIGMPKLNGYEACRRIREQPWGKDMILIALTGWGQDEDKRRTQAAGFNHHLVKPVNTATLINLLAGLDESYRDELKGKPLRPA